MSQPGPYTFGLKQDGNNTFKRVRAQSLLRVGPAGAAHLPELGLLFCNWHQPCWGWLGMSRHINIHPCSARERRQSSWQVLGCSCAAAPSPALEPVGRVAAGTGAEPQPSTAQHQPSMRPGWPCPGAPCPRTFTTASEFWAPLALPFFPFIRVLRDTFPFVCAVSTPSLSPSGLQAPNLSLCHVREFTQVREDVRADVCLWIMKVMFRESFFSGKRTISEML